MSSIARSVSQPVARSVQNWSSANVSKLIKSLFTDGTQGIYLNAQDALSVSDLSSIKDLSGRNNHALQPDSMKRASLITDPSGYKSLKFDGIDDGYVTPSIDFTSTDKVTIIAAIKKTNENPSCIIELSNSFSNPNTFVLFAGNDIVSGWEAAAHGDAATTASQFATADGYPYEDMAVLSSTHDIFADLSTLRRNGVNCASGTGDKGSGNFGNYPLYIGRRGEINFSFAGNIYAILVIGKLLDDATTASIEKEFAKYVGVIL